MSRSLLCKLGIRGNGDSCALAAWDRRIIDGEWTLGFVLHGTAALMRRNFKLSHVKGTTRSFDL